MERYQFKPSDQVVYTDPITNQSTVGEVVSYDRDWHGWGVMEILCPDGTLRQVQQLCCRKR